MIFHVYLLDRSREVPAVAVAAWFSVMLVAMRSVTGVYFVTPMAGWRAAFAHFH